MNLCMTMFICLSLMKLQVNKYKWLFYIVNIYTPSSVSPPLQQDISNDSSCGHDFAIFFSTAFVINMFLDTLSTFNSVMVCRASQKSFVLWSIGFGKLLLNIYCVKDRCCSFGNFFMILEIIFHVSGSHPSSINVVMLVWESKLASK